MAFASIFGGHLGFLTVKQISRCGLRVALQHTISLQLYLCRSLQLVTNFLHVPGSSDGVKWWYSTIHLNIRYIWREIDIRYVFAAASFIVAHGIAGNVLKWIEDWLLTYL